ncbi:hypothetical protein DSUL_20393 [Desulfovibrionales bacterium]
MIDGATTSKKMRTTCLVCNSSAAAPCPIFSVTTLTDLGSNGLCAFVLLVTLIAPSLNLPK